MAPRPRKPGHEQPARHRAEGHRRVDIMLYWYLRIRNWLEEQKGQDLAEYALLIALIALAAVVAVTALGDQISSVFNEIKDELTL